MPGELHIDVVVVHAKEAPRAALAKALTDAGITVVDAVARGEEVPALLNRFHPDAVVLATDLGGPLTAAETLDRVAHVLPGTKRVAVGRGARALEPCSEATVPGAKPAEVVVAVRSLFAAARAGARTSKAARASVS